MGRGRAAVDGVRGLAAAFALIVAASAGEAAAVEKPARLLFGRVEAPTPAKADVIGGYAKGCLAGAVSLDDVGPGFQTMRPSRNRTWGHPSLVKFLKALGEAVTQAGHAPLLIGDLAQPRGGPMLSGHRSHQIGLDADIWFRPSPATPLTRKQRDGWSAYSVVKSVRKPWVNDRFTVREAAVIRLAAEDRRTARIFVAPSIKKALCVAAPKDDRAWLRKVRPWYGHKDHLHVRLACPAGAAGCVDQKPPPAGDGCGKELASWLTPPKPAPKPAKPAKPVKRKEILLSELPEACAAVLKAPAR